MTRPEGRERIAAIEEAFCESKASSQPKLAFHIKRATEPEY